MVIKKSTHLLVWGVSLRLCFAHFRHVSLSCQNNSTKMLGSTIHVSILGIYEKIKNIMTQFADEAFSEPKSFFLFFNKN